jgi:hypothetical protein
MRDKLTRREDRALLKALRELFLNQFPNPERKDCPGSPALEAIATKRISMFDPVHDHVGSCSPCFGELTQMRDSLQRRKLLWAFGTASTAVLVSAALLTYFGTPRIGNMVRPNAAQIESPVRPADQPGATIQPEAARPTQSPPKPQYELATLDLRDASATRTVEPAGTNTPRLEIPRRLLALTIQLPIGSDAGPYEIELRKSGQLTAVVSTEGQATIENGYTKFLIHVDTTSIPVGEYDFAWRRADLSWRNYPILIR